MKIIDVHVHVGDLFLGDEYPSFCDRVPWDPGSVIEREGFWASASRERDEELALEARQKRESGRAGMANLPQLLKCSAPFGVSISVLQPIEPIRETDDNLNLIAEYKSSWRMMLSSSFSLDKIKREEGMAMAASEMVDNSEPPLTIKTFASVHPLDPDKERKLIRYHERGCLGLKLHPILQNLAPEDPAYLETLEIWARFGKPVLLHAGTSGYLGPKSERDSYGDASRFARLLDAFPGTPFILAHLNMNRPEAVYDLASSRDNVHADCSFHGPLHIREAADKMGTGRLLFATDFPFTLPKFALKAGMEATSSDPDFRRGFFHDNAAGLLGI